jgi:hypothetical protein
LIRFEVPAVRGRGASRERAYFPGFGMETETSPAGAQLLIAIEIPRAARKPGVAPLER